MKTKGFLLGLSLGCLEISGIPCRSQNAFVVPSKNAKKGGNYSRWDLFYTGYLPTHQQWLYDVSDVGPAAAVIKSMALRRNNNFGSKDNPQGKANVDILLSISPNDSKTASTTFSKNFGSVKQKVFSGTLALPKALAGTGVAPFTVKIPFSSPFIYVGSKGKALLVDIHVYTYDQSNPWTVDAQGPGKGEHAYLWKGQTCKFSDNKFCMAVSYIMPMLGQAWNVNYFYVKAFSVGIGVLGNKASGNWNGINLPLYLGPLGAPGCFWVPNILFTVPLKGDAKGMASWPQIMIPNDPALGKAFFYDQGAFLDAKANALGVVTTCSNRWVIGGYDPPPGIKVYVWNDLTPPYTKGFLSKVVPVVEFTY